MADARLFGVRLSPFVEKVARALQLKKIPFTLVAPANPMEFKRWNPQTSKMPVLEVAGERTFDSSLILRRLDRMTPSPPLFDPDSSIAARQRFLEDWSDESLYWYGMALRWTDANAAQTSAQVLAMLPAFIRPIAGLILPRRLRSMTWAQGLARLPLQVLTDELGHRLDELLEFLGSRPFFFSDRVSAADLALFGQFSMQRSGPTPQAEALINARPALLAYIDRVDTATAA
jgi:glutathione S-transferase